MKQRPLAKAVLQGSSTAIAAAAGLPFLSPALGALAEPIFAEQARRQSVALRAAEAYSGLSREEIADRVRNNPAAINAMTKFLFATGENGHDEILALIGASLVRTFDALEGRGDLVVEEMLLGALAGITPIHVDILRTIRQVSESPDSELPDRLARESEVLGAPRISDSASRFVLADLVAKGLIDRPNVFGDDEDSNFYGVTELGSFVLSAGAEYQARVP